MTTEEVELTILRTSDASKAQVAISTQKTLNDLKAGISRSTLGPIDPTYQRLFHLGRELKSGGRSLSKLGLGRLGNFVVHLHSTQPEAVELLSDDEGAKAPASAVIDLLEDSDDEVAVIDNPPRKRQRA
uniref:Ubiquitin-like domain-containing protein n=1 Tax=Cyclophora tenuis TaxID=216820 RepID=A0A7S1CYT4_CYCTE|mmetsp:Transcript_11561/g.19570  ORF Transcript_11561/g.19570 Transcript_11561/m.19570 type:complete len:129 (+) Transcript_11561:202-588(+)|eukprot:CAMPEP_0116550352 /NCGR_PEP_ID=MMETSP0397-20121206/5381_1 /TAXON_ID=216820 /ORGANISM="Cyclophora tenuis, Strain ECT3854" /LENGTH=128 /DNA_ID=CAMNT_0004075177 /DNA_START=122 /DNA_END=508 /DNA_ORIENTATION=-